MAPLHGATDLVLLPETFTSGFSNEAIHQAETMDGPTVDWLRGQSRANWMPRSTGSVQLRTDDGVFNRLFFATPDGSLQHYDKRHLFRYAKEHERYAAGRDRLTVEWKGWRICPLVCYDLRFPVYSRNRYDVERPGGLDYDLLLYVANWPAARAQAWRTLLPRARDRKPVLRRGPQPRRHRRQRPALFGRQRRVRLPRTAADGTGDEEFVAHHGAQWRSIARPPRAIPGDARRATRFRLGRSDRSLA